MCNVSMIFVDGWTKAYTIATIAGVVGGFIGLCLIWFEIKATRISAKAALLTAQAVINTERPWLVVTWTSSKKISG